MEHLAELTEEARTLALARFRLLQPHLEDGRPPTRVAAAAAIPFRTAQRWVALYRKIGVAGLPPAAYARRLSSKSATEVPGL